jgi:hypothetical protein
MNEHLNLINSMAWARELESEAERRRLGKRLNGSGSQADLQSGSLVIRASRPDDAAALQRLAELDGLPYPGSSNLLVAEVEGAVLAALPVEGGEPIADPFRATAHLVEVLSLRAEQLRDPASPRRRLRGRILSLLRGRPAPAVAPVTPANVSLLMRRDGQ